MVIVNTDVNKGERSVDRQDRREERDYQKAKEEEVRQFESYFSENSEREAKADSRSREELFNRMQAMMDQKNAVLFDQDKLRQRNHLEEDIAELAPRQDGDSGMIAVAGGSSSPVLEDTPIESTAKDIHAVVKRVMDQQMVFSNITVSISVAEDRKIDVSLLEQKGKMLVYLSSGSHEMKELMHNSQDILEQELRSSVMPQH